MTEPVESVLQKSREEFEKCAESAKLKMPRWVPRANTDDYERALHDIAWNFWQASRSALEPILAELDKVRESRSQSWARERELREDREKLRDLLRQYRDEHKEYALEYDKDNDDCYCDICSLAKQALSPSPTPAKEPMNSASGTDGKFPWICLKCGGFFVNETFLFRHITGSSPGHRLSADELLEFSLAMEKIAQRIQRHDAKPSPDSATPRWCAKCGGNEVYHREDGCISHGATGVDFQTGKPTCPCTKSQFTPRTEAATTGKGEQG